MPVPFLPKAPARDSPSTFVEDAETFFDSITTFNTDLSDYIDNIGSKKQCNLAIENNITISSPSLFYQTLVVTGSRVLLIGQTNLAENGIYEVTSTGAWVRSSDANTSEKLAGAFVEIGFEIGYGTFSGRVYHTKFKASDILNTDPITWGLASIVNSRFGSVIAPTTATTANMTAPNILIMSGSFSPSLPLTTGTGNIAIGYNALNNTTTGNNNICIGNGARPSTDSVSSEIVIGTTLVGTGTGGLVGKGTNTTFIGAGTSGTYRANNTTTWNTTSDQRLKKNILLNQQGVQVIDQIKIYNFEYKTADEITELPKENCINISGIQLGPIAQELPQEFVSTNETGVLSVNASNLIWYLVNAIKELNARIKYLKNKLA